MWCLSLIELHNTQHAHTGADIVKHHLCISQWPVVHGMFFERHMLFKKGTVTTQFASVVVKVIQKECNSVTSL
jgi:hypothetical protein